MAEAKVKATKANSGTILDFSNKTVEQRLAFKPRISLKNLCIGQLVSVELRMTEVDKYDENGAERSYEYAGMTVPTLYLTFKQQPTKEDPSDRYLVHRESIIVSKNNKGEDIDQKQLINTWQNMYGRLRHICNAFIGVKGYLDVEDCPGVDISASAETRVEQATAFFQYFVDILTRENEDTKKPMYEGVNLFMKLVAEYTSRKYLDFPRYVNRGFIERVKPNTNPTLEFAPGETVQLADTTKKSAVEKATANVTEDEVDPEVEKLLAGL